MAGSTAETAEQAKEKLSGAASKGKETAGDASRPVQVGIRAPTTPDHKVGHNIKGRRSQTVYGFWS